METVNNKSLKIRNDSMDEQFREMLNKEPINKLYRELPNYFDYNIDIEKNAYLNWRFSGFKDIESQFYELGKSYFETAIFLLERCLEDNSDKKSDAWIFPILFNTVHGIEVYLKGFNSQIQRLVSIEFRQEIKHFNIEGNHDIKQLCQISISKFSEYVNKSSNIDKKSDDTKNKEKELKFVLKFIELLYEKTNDMSAMRYPIDKKNKERQFYNDVFNFDNIVIDLQIYKVWIYKVFSILENITGFIDWAVGELEGIYYECRNRDY